jgi:hypothetical protein
MNESFKHSVTDIVWDSSNYYVWASVRSSIKGRIRAFIINSINYYIRNSNYVSAIWGSMRAGERVINTYYFNEKNK